MARVRESKLPLDYVIVGILSNLPKKINDIPTSKPRLHSAFFELRAKYKMLSKIPFETSYYPYSEFIEQAFDNIELSSLISKINPILQKYQLNKSRLKEFYTNEVKTKLKNYEIKELKHLANDFATLVT